MTEEVEQTLVERLRARAQSSIQRAGNNGLATLLEEAALLIEDQQSEIAGLTCDNDYMRSVIIDLQNAVEQGDYSAI